MNEKSFGLDLTEGRVSTLLIRFAAPFMLANLVSAMYGIIDMIIVGQFTNSAIMNGVATGTQILSLTFSFIMGIGTGGTVLIGRFVGAKNDEGSAKATGNLLFITAAIILLLTAVIWFFRDALIGILQTPPESVASARRFVMICTIGVPFNVAFGMLSAVSRGVGNSKVPGIVAAICCVINVTLAYTLVGLAGLEEAGAGIATAAAQFASFALIGLWLYRNKLPFKFTARDLRPGKAPMGKILIVGLPIVLQEILVTISFMIIMGLVNAIGSEAGAAVGVVSRAFNIAVIFPLGMSSAISAITAQSIGAGKPERAQKTLKLGIIYSVCIALAIFLFCQFKAEAVTAVFTDERVVIEGAANYLRSFMIDSMFIAVIFCMNAYLSGCGRSSISMMHSLVATFAIRVPLSILFTGAEGISLNETLRNLGYAAPIASTFSLVFCVIYVWWYSKRLAAQTQLQGAPR